jgi:hypothetical protein
MEIKIEPTCENCGTGEIIEVAYNIIDEHGHNRTLCWYCVCKEYIRLETIKIKSLEVRNG